LLNAIFKKIKEFLDKDTIKYIITIFLLSIIIAGFLISAGKFVLGIMIGSIIMNYLEFQTNTNGTLYEYIDNFAQNNKRRLK